MDKMDVGFVEKKGYQGNDVVIYRKTTVCQRAQFAMTLIERSITLGVDAGEDSAGRAKVIESPIAYIVGRACAIADMTFNEFESRGWLLELPSPAQIKTSEG